MLFSALQVEVSLVYERSGLDMCSLEVKRDMFTKNNKILLICRSIIRAIINHLKQVKRDTTDSSATVVAPLSGKVENIPKTKVSSTARSVQQAEPEAKKYTDTFYNLIQRQLAVLTVVRFLFRPDRGLMTVNTAISIIMS